MRFDFAVRCRVGARFEQQDAVALWASGNCPWRDEVVDGSAGSLVIAVADGMGGHVGGALASRIACAAFMAAMTTSAGDTAARLCEGVAEANAALQSTISEDEALRSMGCTLASVALGSGQLEWASLGDTHVFLARDGRLLELNADQSGKPLVRKLVAAKVVDAEDARDRPETNRLAAALTGGETGPVDRSHLPVKLRAGDIVIIATDGIDTLEQADILKLGGGDGSAATLAERLLAAVDAAGDPEQDNTTVCVARVLDDGIVAVVPQGLSGQPAAKAYAAA